MALVLAGLISTLAVTDAHTRTALRRSNATLAEVRTHTHQVLVRLATTRLELAVDRTTQSAAQAALAEVDVQLTSTDSQLSATNSQLTQETAYVDELNSCLSGVEQALNAISVGDTPHAVAALDAVHTVCRQAQAGA